MHISFAEAAIGCELEVPTLDGKVKYTVPAGTQGGDIFKLRGRGIQNINGRGKGDQLVRIIVDIPKSLNAEQKELLKKFDATLGNTSRFGEDTKHNFFGKKKK
jgi:molecular chaperone DnaJ